MYDFTSKIANLNNANRYMLAKTSTMFEWEGLPESLPRRELERMLQSVGYAFITMVEGSLYAFTGGLGGEPDVYGNPTKITVSNPALKLTQTFNLTDGVLLVNDDFKMGLMPMLNRYNTMMVENDLNMLMYGINSRMQTFISAGDDKSKASAESFLKKLLDGELGVIAESALFENIKVHTANGSSNARITSLVEFQQYMKGSLYNEIGLNANFNMKRERLTSGEVGLDDGLFPFVDNMMHCRIIGAAELNEKYSLEIAVDYGGVWHKKNRELVDGITEISGGELSTDQDETIETNLSGSVSESSLGSSLEPLDGSTKNDKEVVTEILEDETLPDDERSQWLEVLEEIKEVEDES